METPNSSESVDEGEAMEARAARRRVVMRGGTAETANAAAVKRLVEMGFDRHWCEAALKEADDFDQALAVLLAGGKRGPAAEAPRPMARLVADRMDVEPKEGRRSTPGESPLAGPHRALDGIGRFADPDALKALRVVGKRFNAHSRLPAAIRRCFEKRWAARSVSKRARWRLEAVEAMGRCLGVDAEEFLTKTLKGDKLQAVRAASAGWLARIARRAAPETKKRIFAAACERYDAERGRMNVRQAIERSFPDVYESCEELVRQHPKGGALAAFVAATRAAREAQLKRQQEALKAASAGVMGGKIHLFRECAAGFRRVHFKVDRGRDDSLKLAFANPLERSVLLRRYESRGLVGDQRLDVVEIPPRSVRHFATLEFPSSCRRRAPPPRPGAGPPPRPPAPTNGPPPPPPPKDRWVLRVPPLEACAHPLLAPDRWIFNGSGLLRLEARFRGRYDTRGAQDCHREPPFELWTFELGPGALTCRVDPVLSNFVTPFGYDPTPTRTPLGYKPQPPPPPPPTHWRQSLSDERARGIVTSVKPAKKAEKKNQHSEWLHRYPDPVQLLPATRPANLDVEARPGHPREFLFSDDAEPQPRQVFNQWPGLRPRAEEVAAQAAQEDDGEHPPGWREAWRALGPPAVLAAETLAGPAHDPRLAMRPSSFNTGVEPSPAPPTATDLQPPAPRETAALLEQNIRVSTGQSAATYSAASSLNPAALPGGRDYVAPPGTESMLREQLDYARALDFDNATLEELSEAVAALGEIRDIAVQVLGSAHPDTVNMENLLQEAQDALAARQAVPQGPEHGRGPAPPPPGSA